jgi:hypothetical protein
LSPDFLRALIFPLFILSPLFSLIMPATLNSRAKMPADLASMGKQFKISYRDLLSTNPKTEKSAVQTYILHLAPHNISGVNVCPGAGNCKKICLHFAGNPVYMTNKQTARIRRTLAFAADKQRFARLIVCSILDKMNKNPGEPIAIRLNGTSDIAWENVDFDISPEFSTFCRVKFGHSLPIGKRNIFEIFNCLRADCGFNVTFYDYTKIKRNWAECQRLGYHLTFSFDGWENAPNLAIAKDALRAGVNVAAAFNLKKAQQLPQYVDCARFNFLESDKMTGRVFAVYDGDLSDFRPSDPQAGVIIGLRFKLPHGIKYTDAEKTAFCIA